MTKRATPDAYGALIEPATLKIERLLPGPIERIWAYITDSDLRRRWLASGDMQMKAGAPFEFVWRNDELSDPPGKRPEGFSKEHRMQSRVVACDPPHKLVITWGENGEVTFDLEPIDDDVLLTIIHRRLPDRATTLMVGAGWHMHLDTLAAIANGKKPAPFWDGWSRLREDYDRRVPSA
jgi:uncharacterized protein YndB with AHSA1/START domain